MGKCLVHFRAHESKAPPSKLDLKPESRVHEFLEIQSQGIQNGSQSLKSKATLHPLERERGDLGTLAL
jgi:hypothetical protein